MVYQIKCSRCDACYVGQTVRHLTTRIKEHLRVTSPVGKHFKSRDAVMSLDDVVILSSTHRYVDVLLTLEALYIRELKPSINTRDEYRSRELTIKI